MLNKKGDVMENLDNQIEKLRDNNNSEKEEKTTTKIFKGNIANTDTKVFDSSNMSVDKEETQKVDVEPPKSKNKNKYKLLIIILSILIVAVILIAIVLINSSKPTQKPVDDYRTLTEEERVNLIKKYGEALEDMLGVYYSKNGVLLEYEELIKLVKFDENIRCGVHEIYKDGKIYLKKCSVNGIISKYEYGVKQESIEIDSDTLKVYVEKKSQLATLETPKNEKLYDVYVVHCGEGASLPELVSASKDYVFYYDNNGYIQMINFKTDTKVLSNLDYTFVSPIKKDGEYDTNYLAVVIENFWGIYTYEGEQIISPSYSGIISIGSVRTMPLIATSNNVILVWNGKTYGAINYTNNKPVIPLDYEYIIASGSYFYAADEEGFGYLYDNVGNRYLTDYDRIYASISGMYTLVRDDKNVKLVQLDGKMLYNYGEIENIGINHFNLAVNDIVKFQFGSLDNNSVGCIEISYNTSTKKGEVKDTLCGGID